MSYWKTRLADVGSLAAALLIFLLVDSRLKLAAAAGLVADESVSDKGPLVLAALALVIEILLVSGIVVLAKSVPRRPRIIIEFAELRHFAGHRVPMNRSHDLVANPGQEPRFKVEMLARLRLDGWFARAVFAQMQAGDKIQVSLFPPDGLELRLEDAAQVNVATLMGVRGVEINLDPTAQTGTLAYGTLFLAPSNVGERKALSVVVRRRSAGGVVHGALLRMLVVESTLDEVALTRAS